MLELTYPSHTFATSLLFIWPQHLIDIPQYFGRIAGHDAVRRNILSDYAARSDDGIWPDVYICEDGSSGTDRGALLDHRWFDSPVRVTLQVAFASGCTRIGIVSENNAMSNEDVVLDHYALADKGMALNLAAFSYDCVFLYLNKCADFCLVTDFTSI